MKRFLKFLCIPLVLLAALAVGAASGDYAAWGRPGAFVWRITSSGDLTPGSTLTRNVGTSSLRVASVYGNDPVGGAINCTNTTLTAANVGRVFLVNMTGNHTITLPTAASAGNGAEIEFQEICNKTGSTGNWTINVTSSGNINLVDSMAVTNTSGATGNVSRVSVVSDGSAWFGYVVRKP